MKKRHRIIFLLAILILVFAVRGPLFRLCVAYDPAGIREPVMDQKTGRTTVSPENRPDDPGVNIHTIITRTLDQTAEKLEFSFGNCASDPERLLLSKKANCIGYARLFCHLFEKNTASGKFPEWTAQPYIGHISIFGKNIHPYVRHPFFKDHDFVIINNRVTGEKIAVDPSLYDYTGIGYVR